MLAVCAMPTILVQRKSKDFKLNKFFFQSSLFQILIPTKAKDIWFLPKFKLDFEYEWSSTLFTEKIIYKFSNQILKQLLRIRNTGWYEPGSAESRTFDLRLIRTTWNCIITIIVIMIMVFSMIMIIIVINFCMIIIIIVIIIIIFSMIIIIIVIMMIIVIIVIIIIIIFDLKQCKKTLLHLQSHCSKHMADM